MRVLIMSTLGLAISLVHGCSSGQAPQPPASPQQSQPPAPGKTVFDPMTQQLDRAREVQKTVDKNADDTRKSIDSQERGDANP